VAVLVASLLLIATVTQGTHALWRTSDHAELSVRIGQSRFAVGSPGQPLVASKGDAVGFTVGAAEAQTLMTQGRVHVPIQVDALAQGNNGLTYTIDLPEFGDTTVFGSADIALVKVITPSSCPQPMPGGAPQRQFTSTPVPAAYSDSTVPTTEYWCFQAVLGPLPGAGTHESTVTATGESGIGPVTGTATWKVGVESAVQAKDEPNHTITFTPTLLTASA